MAQLKDLSTPAKRLADAISRWGSIRAFSDELKARGARGAHRTMVHRYLAGTAEPGPQFYRVAAEVLGVRVEWLRDGEPPRTEAELARGGPDGVDLWTRVQEAIPNLKELGPEVTGALLALALRIHNTAARYGVDAQQELETTAAGIWNRIAEPIDEWSRLVGRSLQMDPEEFSLYAMAQLHALSLSVSVALPTWLTKEGLEAMPALDADLTTTQKPRRPASKKRGSPRRKG